MFSIYQRVNALTSLLSSCLIGLLVAITLSSFVFSPSPSGRLDVTPLKVAWGKSGRMGAQELAFVRFDVQSDLSSLFHWNTKQLFIWLAAEYTNEKGVKNDVVIWDRIVRRKEDAIVKIESGKNKYVFRDYSKSFRNATGAEYVLRYNVMPYVGMLSSGEAGRSESAVEFPEVSRQ